MPKAIIGLDLGSTSIKAVKATVSGKSFEIVETYFMPRSETPADGGSNLFDDVRLFFERYGLAADNVCAAFPRENRFDEVFVRLGAFYAEGKRSRIADFIEEQLLPNLPFAGDSTDDSEVGLIHDYPRNTGKASGTTVLLGAATTETIGGFIDGMKAAGANPVSIDEPAASLANLVASRGYDGVPIVIMEIGGAHATICYCLNDSIRALRTLPSGAELLRRKLAAAGADPRGPFEERSWTFEGFAPEGKASAEVREIAEKWVGGFVRHLDGILRNIPAPAPPDEGEDDEDESEAKAPPRILLCGGGARIPGLAEKIAELTGVGTELLGENDSENGPVAAIDDPALFASALALAFKERLGNKSPSLNFRKGEFVHKREDADLRNKSIYAGVMAGISLMLGAFMLLTGFFGKKAEVRAVEAQILAIFNQALPNTPPVDPLAQLAQLVERARNGGGSLDNSPPFIDVFRAMSEKIPGEVSVRLKDLSFDSKSLKIKGETTSYEAVDKIKSALEQTPGVAAVAVKETRGCGGTTESCIKFTIAADFTADFAAEVEEQ